MIGQSGSCVEGVSVLVGVHSRKRAAGAQRSWALLTTDVTIL